MGLEKENGWRDKLDENFVLGILAPGLSSPATSLPHSLSSRSWFCRTFPRCKSAIRSHSFPAVTGGIFSEYRHHVHVLCEPHHGEGSVWGPVHAFHVSFLYHHSPAKNFRCFVMTLDLTLNSTGPTPSCMYFCFWLSLSWFLLLAPKESLLVILHSPSNIIFN